jgi:predicted nuclease of restriction endonuclease-like (RecB) superfamily
MSELLSIPNGYPELLQELKDRIRTAQVQAALAVNRELVLLYWSIGLDLSQRFSIEGWGTKINERLAKDLQAAFPGVEGFSPRNLRYMRSFAEAWPDPAILQQLIAKLPWGHNLRVLDRIKDRPTREWYLRAALENGWSQNVLVHMISGQLHTREGKSLTNFERLLPPPGSDMAEQVLRDPYNFEFLGLTKPFAERELEKGLLIHLRDLLLELGRGFAFVGSQVPLVVDDRSFYVDLLFYHVRLHCYFVIELKTGEFQPEYAGKLGFYIAAIDGTMRTPGDGRTIGLLLCESRSGPVVEYALQSIDQPIGVSTYRVTRELPAPVRGELPSVEDLQNVVVRMRADMDALREDGSNGS